MKNENICWGNKHDLSVLQEGKPLTGLLSSMKDRSGISWPNISDTIMWGGHTRELLKKYQKDIPH